HFASILSESAFIESCTFVTASCTGRIPSEPMFFSASLSDCSDDFRSSVSGWNSDLASSASVSAFSCTLSSASCSADVPFCTMFTFFKSVIDCLSAVASSHTCDDEPDDDDVVSDDDDEVVVFDDDELSSSSPPHAATPAPSTMTTAVAATKREVKVREVRI